MDQMKNERNDKRFGNRYIIMVQHKDSGYLPFFVTDDEGNVSSDTKEAKEFKQGQEISNVRGQFNKDYIITKILMNP